MVSCKGCKNVCFGMGGLSVSAVVLSFLWRKFAPIYQLQVAEARIKTHPADIDSNVQACRLMGAEGFTNREESAQIECWMSLAKKMERVAYSMAGHTKKKNANEITRPVDGYDRELPYKRFLQHSVDVAHALSMYSEGEDIPRKTLMQGTLTMAAALQNVSYCHEDVKELPAPCTLAFAELILRLRMVHESFASSQTQQDALSADIERHWKASKSLPHLPTWTNSGRLHIQLPGIRAQPLWDCHELPAPTCKYIRSVEAGAKVVQDELTHFLEVIGEGKPNPPGLPPAIPPHLAWKLKETQPELNCSSDGEGWARWSSLTLLESGKLVPKFCGKGAPFEKTCSILQGNGYRPEFDATMVMYKNSYKYPKMAKPQMFATIYRLVPGTWLRPHYGMSGRLVISLGLSGTEKATGGSSACSSRRAQLRVGGQTKQWTPGQSLIFDDAFEHDVQLPAGAPVRYVLMFKILHPELMGGLRMPPGQAGRPNNIR
eukprot:gnl/MRDRNA2_/MRDRNA2_69957_c0_seq2.p1 gnl/MRDRNA2_/MRDRNA2_69957_c0~~gnl/MRDRNA2_/MRDRNA2_69957_c0_seq2.p1  ORF type:complete len:488 (+),score=83.29 gnl/MRDRNA2_/MRDRNA2_69957_c0_seq2:99-1562(+)